MLPAVTEAEIEEFLKGSLKAQKPTGYKTMAQLIIEEAPQNGKELYDSIGQQIENPADSYNRAMKKIFTQLFKDLDQKKMIGPKKEKVVEETKTVSDEETPNRQEETDVSDQGTPSFIKEQTE